MSVELNIFAYIADPALITLAKNSCLPDASKYFKAMFDDLKDGDSFVSTGSFVLDEDIFFRDKKLVQGYFHGKMYRKVGTNASIKIYDNAECDIYINQYCAPEVSSLTAPTNGFGIDIRGDVDTTVDIGYVNGFENNIYLSTTEKTGSWGNTIKWKTSENSKRPFIMTTDGLLKCYNNGNKIYGGQMRGETCFSMVKGANQTDRFNGNELLSGNFEAGTTALSLDYTRDNEFHGRIESGQFLNELTTTANCKGGEYHIKFRQSRCQMLGISERFYAAVYDDNGDAIAPFVYTNNAATIMKSAPK